MQHPKQEQQEDAAGVPESAAVAAAAEDPEAEAQRRAEEEREREAREAHEAAVLAGARRIRELLGAAKASPFPHCRRSTSCVLQCVLRHGDSDAGLLLLPQVPPCPEPKRGKTHWDCLLEEMTVGGADGQAGGCAGSLPRTDVACCPPIHPTPLPTRASLPAPSRPTHTRAHLSSTPTPPPCSGSPRSLPRSGAGR